MIKEKIIVEYVIDPRTKKVAINPEDLYIGKEWKDWGDYIERKKEFNIFKNNGKVSKTDMSQYECVNKEAEKILLDRLKIKEDTENDLTRAIQLAKIVSEAFNEETNRQPIEWNTLEKGNFSDENTPGWVTIKVKTSRSKWYENDGFGHARTCYYCQVPKSVGKEAKELREIRKKHKYNELFQFYLTDYPTREVRVADHKKW